MKISVFDNLLFKKMTRKEFIIHLGLLLFVLTGISGLISILSDPHLTNRQADRGFGSGPYGV